MNLPVCSCVHGVCLCLMQTRIAWTPLDGWCVLLKTPFFEVARKFDAAQGVTVAGEWSED